MDSVSSSVNMPTSAPSKRAPYRGRYRNKPAAAKANQVAQGAMQHPNFNPPIKKNLKPLDTEPQGTRKISRGQRKAQQAKKVAIPRPEQESKPQPRIELSDEQRFEESINKLLDESMDESLDEFFTKRAIFTSRIDKITRDNFLLSERDIFLWREKNPISEVSYQIETLFYLKYQF